MTKRDLWNKLMSENIPKDLYSLDGGLPNEMYCLSHEGNTWEIYYSEMGQKTGLKCFNTEKDACEYFYHLLMDELKDMHLEQEIVDDKETPKWMECDGGPHLLLEKGLVKSWRGPEWEFYYEKACEVEDYIGIIAVHDGYGVVIAEDVPRSTWISAKDKNGGYLIVLNYADESISKSDIKSMIRGIDEELYKATDLQLSIQDNSLYLFAACDAGPDWMYGYVEILINPGVYKMDTMEGYSFNNCNFTIYRFKI